MMNASTGQRISVIDHLKQSIRDILTTPIGARVMRPDYGSVIPSLIDAPVNNTTLVEIYAGVAAALRRFEPRYKVSRVQVANHTPGQLIIDLEGTYLVNGEPLKLEGIQL
ncbi:GPW/gp25 family protein [Pseudoalteromonas luteoviolacea]|uniref:GPW/gp25 family protein n=1 Tax=Pseudoalteromonas luteoviolacea TaxID=43657 RepID=UPI00114F9C34|nr:GPW/gp25 family protein [Pseudoalteromonas luteoviolacea]TQF69548.1 hypothetical protein FLM44_00070 [Pseudoalteromonas luteoviolacea]